MSIACYFLGSSRPEESPGLDGFVHLIEHVNPTETPGGTDCEEKIAYCGDTNPGYSMGGFTLWSGTVSEAVGRGLKICPKCVAALPVGRKIDGLYLLTAEEAGYRETPGAIVPSRHQSKCRYCGSSNVKDSFSRIGMQGEENHYIDCQDCTRSENLGMEY